MCQSPNSSLVRRTIDLNYANKQRAASLKWLLVNGALLAVLAFDLWRWCGGWGSATAWVEAVGACVLAANCVQHAARLAPPRAPRPLPLSPHQQLLLGLKDSDLDSSFLVREQRTPPPVAPPASRARPDSPGSLSPPRSWRAPDSPGSPAGGGASPPRPHHAPAPSERASPDEFISDARTLAAYVRTQSARAGEAAGAGAARAGGGLALPSPPRAHQLAVLPERGSTESSGGAGEEESGAGGSGGGGGGGGAGGAPLWRRLHVDPQRLTEYNLNLRLWLHVSVVGRVARELAAAEAAGVNLATLGSGGRADALLPFLRPFADRQYVADRVQELSAGGCLSAYRWDGGGRGWHAARPSDAELLLHLLAAYLDLLAPPPGFSARHLSVAPRAAAAHPGPVLHRVCKDPPHYVLLLGEETVELPRGRNNLLHTLLLFIAAAARGAPPALCRLHLGPAGLNMLWILGR